MDACLGPGLWSVAASSEGENPDKQLVSLSLGHMASLLAWFSGVAPLVVLPLLACMHAKLLQVCLTLCYPIDCSPPGSSVHGILQARILERVVMPFSSRSSHPGDQTWVYYVFCIDRWVLYH